MGPERQREKVNLESLKVAFVSAYPFGVNGGVQDNIRNSARVLSEELGHQVIIIAPRYGPAEETQDLIHLGRGKRIPFNFEGTTAIVGFPRAPKEEVERALQERPDVIHFHEPEVSWPSLQLLANSEAPLNVATFHTVKKGVYIYYIFKILIPHYGLKLDTRIAVSQAAKEFVSRYFPGEYQIIPNGVDTSRFHPDVPKIPEFADGKHNILFVGRLEERKGASHLIEAYARLRKNRDDIRLIIVGKGPLEASLRKQVESQRIADVCFEGQVPACILPGYYARSDICSFPSVHGESFGVVLLEAMASGKPVIAGENEGYQEVVLHGHTGFLVNPLDYPQFAYHLDKLLENPHLRSYMGENGRKTAEEHDWKKVGQQLLSLYREKLREKGAI